MRRFILIGFLLGIFGLSLGITNTSYADPPPWAPAHGYRAKKHHHHHDHKKVVHRYYYYPSSQVYYSPVRKQYLWLDAGVWRFGVKLPDSIKIGGVSRVLVETPYDDRPYVEHVIIKD